jgi:hypothetical protein
MMEQPPKAQTAEKVPDEQRRKDNVKKAKEVAEGLYPREKWEVLEA